MGKQLIYGPLFALGVLKPFAALKTWWVPQGFPSATCGCDVTSAVGTEGRAIARELGGIGTH